MTLEDWALREQQEWRQLHTYGGYLWPDVHRVERSQEPPMTVDEALDEVEWLLNAGMSPHLALEQIDRVPDSLRRSAERRGRYELARRIAQANHADWHRRWNEAS